MSDLENIRAAVNAADDDARPDVLAAALAELPYDTQVDVAAELALGYAQISIGLTRAAAATGGAVLAWMHAVIDNEIVSALTANLDDDLEALTGDDPGGVS